MAKDSYIVKLLTMLVRKNGGCVRIPATELMTADLGQGIRVYWDDNKKELVVDFMPSGAKVYVINEVSTWLGSQVNQEPIQPLLPKSQDELIAKVWTDSAASPTNQELARPKIKSRVVSNLEDESLASVELERRKREILKDLENYQSPNPVAIPSSNRTTFYKQ